MRRTLRLTVSISLCCGICAAPPCAADAGSRDESRSFLDLLSPSGRHDAKYGRTFAAVVLRLGGVCKCAPRTEQRRSIIATRDPRSPPQGGRRFLVAVFLRKIVALGVRLAGYPVFWAFATLELGVASCGFLLLDRLHAVRGRSLKVGVRRVTYVD